MIKFLKESKKGKNMENVRNQLALSIMDVEYYPVASKERGLAVASSLSLSDITMLGGSFTPVVDALKTAMKPKSSQGAEQLYKFNFHGHEGEMTRRKDGSGFLSTVTKSGEGIKGQGAFVPVDVTSVPMDPVMLAMAVALAGIEKKLDDIKEVQEDILEFLQLQEKAKLKGNLEVLTEVMNNYKHNWNNEKYKNNKHILVQEIKRDSEQSMIFHRDRIKKKLEKESFIHSDQEVKKKVNALVSEMKDYQLALYLYSFSEFLEVMLLENFDSKYLDNVIKKNEEYSYDYRLFYTDLYNKIEKSSNSSIESVVLTGVAGLNKIVGKTISKVPVLGNTKIDETIVGSAEKIEKFNKKRGDNTVSQLNSIQSSVVTPFVNNLKMLDVIYNQPAELLFDSNNLYLVHSSINDEE